MSGEHIPPNGPAPDTGYRPRLAWGNGWSAMVYEDHTEIPGERTLRGNTRCEYCGRLNNWESICPGCGAPQ
jgi:hypothetical protein